MKLFQVDYETDGKTIKEPGIVTTEIKRVTMRYAAQDICEVWEAIGYIRDDEELTLIGVYEIAPQVTVL
jgi:hypothetical protein